MDYVASAVMQKDVITVPSTMTVAQLEASFVQHQVSGFPVVDDGRLVGVVSRTDFIEALSPPEFAAIRGAHEEAGGKPRILKFAETLSDRIKALHVSDIMTADVLTVRPNDGIHDVADLMYHQRIHRIFVVRDDQLLGVITPFDFVRLYSQDRIGADTRPRETKDF